MMPVGKVFNAAENQVQIRPIQAYRQGKAIRAAEKEAEQISELRGLQIDEKKTEAAQAPERWAAAKKLAESQQAQVDESLLQLKRDGKWEEAQRSAQVLIPWVTEIGKLAGPKGENSLAAMDMANETSAQMIENLSGVVSPEGLEKLQGIAGSDHKWQMEEIMSLGNYLNSFRKMDAVEGKSLAKDAILVNPITGEEMASNKGAGDDKHSTRYQQAIDGGLKPGTPEFESFVLNQGGDSGRQRDDEIKDASELFVGQGFSPEEAHIKAIKFVDEGKKILISQTDNTVYSYDKFTDTLKIEKPSDTRGPEPEIPYAQTMHGLADEATGIGPGAKAVAAKGLGPLGGYTANATTEAKAFFKASENALIEAFRLNPRYPQAEITRIQKNIDIMPKFWDSAEQMRSRMAGSRAYLETELASVEWNLENPAITAKRRGEEESTRDGIRRYLRVLGKPVDATSVEKRMAEIDARLAEIAAEREANVN